MYFVKNQFCKFLMNLSIAPLVEGIDAKEETAKSIADRNNSRADLLQ